MKMKCFHYSQSFTLIIDASSFFQRVSILVLSPNSHWKCLPNINHNMVTFGSLEDLWYYPKLEDIFLTMFILPRVKTIIWFIVIYLLGLPHRQLSGLGKLEILVHERQCSLQYIQVHIVYLVISCLLSGYEKHTFALLCTLLCTTYAR